MAGTRTEILRRVPLFSNLEPKELEQIERTMSPRTFRSGETIATEGQGGVGFFVIEDGEATVTVHGQERGRLGPGDYFGEIALIAGTDRTASVTAATELRCLGMTPWEFRPLVESNAAIAWKLLQALAEKLRAAEQRTP